MFFVFIDTYINDFVYRRCDTGAIFSSKSGNLLASFCPA